MKTKKPNTNLNLKNEFSHFGEFVFGNYYPNQQRKLGDCGLPADQNVQNQPAVLIPQRIRSKRSDRSDREFQKPDNELFL